MPVDRKKPNILLVILDCLRADHLSCYGYRKPTSPRIDGFARDSTLFVNAFAPSPWTIPSHASLFTGKFPSELSINRQYLYLNDQHLTLAEFLLQRGYKTIMLSHNPLVGPASNLSKGFEDYVPLFKKPSGKIGYPGRLLRFARFGKCGTKGLFNRLERAVESRGGAGASRPFFVFINLLNIHPPSFPPFRIMGRFYPPLFNPYLLFYLVFFKILGGLLPRSVFGETGFRVRENQLLRYLYDLEILFADHQIGACLEWLREKSFADDTLVIITSDHGEHLGEHGFSGHGISLYDPQIKIPLIIRHPRYFRPNEKSRAMVSLPDIFHTIVDLVGDPQKTVDSFRVKQRSLLNRSGEETDYIFSEVDEPFSSTKEKGSIADPRERIKVYQAKQCVRSNNFKYFLYQDGTEELFDLINDPEEEHNVAENNYRELIWFRKKLDIISKRFPRLREKPTGQYSHEQITKHLRALGYLD